MTDDAARHIFRSDTRKGERHMRDSAGRGGGLEQGGDDLAYAGDRERTEAEFTQLLAQARLRLVSTSPLAAGPQVLEAVAV